MKILLAVFLFPVTALAQSPLKYVDPLIGTGPATTISAQRHSESEPEGKGQTFPAVGRPFGMTQWTPETRTTENKCVSPYYYTDSLITGFRGTHWMSGSCTQDYGSITLMPFISSRPDTIKSSPASEFSHINEIATPAYYSLILDDYRVQAEITGSVRSGMMRLRYPKEKVSCLFIRINSDENKGMVWLDLRHNEIVGYNPVHRIYQGKGQSAGFCGYFIIRFDKQFRVIPNQTGQQNMVVSFGDERNVLVRIGTSFISLDAARNNLNNEIPDWNFDKLSKETGEVWNKTLGKVQVKGGSEDDLRKFYTALYHCYQLPRIVSDIDGSYEGFADDTLIHIAKGFDYYDDFSMWDTYRALHPLLTILEPKRTLDMAKSLILKARQGGWMPIFPAWGSYTAAMIGDHVSTMISDVYVKGIRDFDLKTAYQYMRQNAFENPSQKEYVDGKGRRALSSYLKYGYVPLEDSVWDAFHKREQVSRTLEYALDDYALAQVAKDLGRKSDYKSLMKRSKNYRKVFDINTGFVRGRYANGHWIEPFNPNLKASYICEGTPHQYTWYVPQDVPGLIKIMGGKTIFLKRLNEFFDGGFYWHGNETDQQAPFMFALAGDPIKTEEWTRKIINEEYGIGPGGLSGNEDAGQMSAWLVCAMMGFYPVCPGTGQYVITTPFFNQIKIELPDGNYFTLNSDSRNDKNLYIESITKNGRKFTRSFLTHQEIMNGDKFVFRVTDKTE